MHVHVYTHIYIHIGVQIVTYTKMLIECIVTNLLHLLRNELMIRHQDGIFHQRLFNSCLSNV